MIHAPYRLSLITLQHSGCGTEPLNQAHSHLRYDPDRFMTHEMCYKAMCENPGVFFFVPDCFKTEEMCIKVV